MKASSSWLSHPCDLTPAHPNKHPDHIAVAWPVLPLYQGVFGHFLLYEIDALDVAGESGALDADRCPGETGPDVLRLVSSVVKVSRPIGRLRRAPPSFVVSLRAA